MRSTTLTIAALMFSLQVSATLAQHADVVPYALNGQIVTGGHDDVAGTDTISLRVFGYDFFEDPFDPYVIGDPGFNNGSFAIGVYPNDGLLPANKTLAFDVVTTLQYWDGSGAVFFGPAPADVALGLNRSSNTVLVSGTGQSGTAPTISGTGAAGRVHVHLESQLHFTDGTSSTPPNAPDGIYMVGLTLKLTDASLADSDPIYFVYNANLDEEVHDEAIDWVEMNLVPEPSTWLLAAMAGCAIVVAGRRRCQSGRQAA